MEIVLTLKSLKNGKTTYDFEPEEDEELELEDEADLVRPFASGEATKLCLCSTRFNLGVPPLETTLFSSLRSKYVPNLVQQAPIFFLFSVGNRS